jgi:rfaE bifunctional protein nucleotidyltransferase chain/domain
LRARIETGHGLGHQGWRPGRGQVWYRIAHIRRTACMRPDDKICLQSDVPERLSTLARPLVMTNGVFDVLHRGHVSYLCLAAELGGSLLVAVNTDRSARVLGKGPDRPLNSELDRAYVLAGLASVDMVTFFDTRTPVELIQAIKPDIYVKGGDYDMEILEETRVVRSWGGQAVAIPFVDGFSTTALVQRIRKPRRKAAFLDRDGVINKDKAYVSRWEDFEFVSGAIEGMRLLQEDGFDLVVVTNQSGLARGYYSEAQYQTLTNHMIAALKQRGVELARVYHCPHHPEGLVPELSIICDCRKPAPGLLVKAARELNLSLQCSVLIGDKPSDIQAARLAGLDKAYIVDSDNPDSTFEQANADGYFASLLACAQYLHHQAVI